MTSAFFVKVLFWIVLIMGVMPSLFVVGGTLFCALKNNEDPEPLVIGVPQSQGEMFIVTRHAGLSVGPLKLSFHPRVWAASLGVVGIVFLVTGRFVLLHVPLSSTEFQ